MGIADRIARLEQAMSQQDAYRLLVIPDDADAAAESAAYRERTGYPGCRSCSRRRMRGCSCEAPGNT